MDSAKSVLETLDFIWIFIRRGALGDQLLELNGELKFCEF